MKSMKGGAGGRPQMSMQQMQQFMAMMGGGRGGGGGGRNQGGRKGGKKVIQGGGKRKGQNKERVPFSELPEERKQEIRERQEARAQEEGRTEVGSEEYTGTLVSRVSRHGWVRPQNPGQLPKEVQNKMRKMCNEMKNKFEDKSSERAQTFGKGVLYVRRSDCEEGQQFDKDMQVRFRVYTDSQGAGAYDVTVA